ncbi:hypothetical protein Tco_0441725 [Tanacetum coccineum]
MSDSEDSTVTYTAVSSPFEDGSDIGSPGVDGPPIMPEDPYAYIMAAYLVLPSSFSSPHLRMEPYYLKCIKDGPFQPKTAEGDAKPESQWTPDERDGRSRPTPKKHHCVMLEVLPDTKENRIIDLKLEYQTFRAKSIESLSQTYTRYKTLLNELANDGVNLSKHKINVGFVNNLHEKWLTFSQGLRNANHTQTLDLADIYGRFVYEDNLIQRRYSDTKKALITTAIQALLIFYCFSNNVHSGFQEID